MKKSKKFNKGFTLVEIMAVLVILGILATLAILNLNPVLDRANLEKFEPIWQQQAKPLNYIDLTN